MPPILFIGFCIVAFVLVVIVIAAFVTDGANKPSQDPRLPTEEHFNIDRNRFRIRYERRQNEIYIRAMEYPTTKQSRRSRCPTKTHVYKDGRICTSKPVKSLEQAKAIARYWATGYVTYIKTGVFPNDGGRVEV